MSVVAGWHAGAAHRASGARVECYCGGVCQPLRIGKRTQSISVAAPQRKYTLCWARENTLIDQDFVDELNRVSNLTLEVLTAGSEPKARELASELKSMKELLEREDDFESCRFIRVLLGLLDHTVIPDAKQLTGMYATAADRILNQMAGSEWRLAEEGKEAEAQEAFSTWDDVLNRSKKQSKRQPMSTGRVKDTTFYSLLEVDVDAEQGQIKSSFRRLALKLHPDVNSSPDANERFAELSAAYDVLSDASSRALYDKFGRDLDGMQGSSGGRGNARDAWDEFKPYRRENKHSRARDAAATADKQNEPPSGGLAASEPDNGRVPQVGDIVEYPLREIETQDFADGRSHGVGLLVGRNIDRGDAKKLPEAQLSLCEVEPLRQEEPDSNRWIADELGISSFARLEEMRVLPVSEFERRYETWTVEPSLLSPGCGGPPLPEEIIL